MLIFNGTEYRNLEEQVLKNKVDIAKHYEIDRALANLGIKVVGQVEIPSQLPDPLTYQGEFGDTYAVGNPEYVAEGTGYYEYYVFTRPDENAGTTTNHWLNVGRISIVGPQGPAGPKGEQGETGESSRWYYGSAGPVAGEDYEYQEGDMWLDGTGNVYRYDGGLWNLTTNIKGPQGVQGIRGLQGERGEQGPQGPQGPQGDVGGFINIFGTLTNAEQLPLPTTLNNLTAAYLVEHTGGTDQANDHYDLYVQVGETSATALWVNAGPFNAATLVTQDGVGLNVWDSDTKLDKNTDITDGVEVYAKKDNGTQTMIKVGAGSLVYGAIPQRADSGTILVPLDPGFSDYSATSKKYVSDGLNTKLTKVASSSSESQVYAKTPAGEQYMIDAGRTVINNGLVQRKANGQIRLVANPADATDAASKYYVDTKTSDKVTKSYVDNTLTENLAVCTYQDFVGDTYKYIQGDAYYMVYSDNPDLKLCLSDGTPIVEGAKQMFFMVATQAKYPTGAYKACGQYWTGDDQMSSVQGFRRAIDRAGYIYGPTGFAVCYMAKPWSEDES